MDRARTELTELDAIFGAFPEFRRFTHRLPFVSERQQHRIILRMARHAMRLDSGCIVWIGACNNDGYPKMNAWSHGEPRQFYVHHLAWRMASGKDMPHWQEHSHKCDTPPCFHPGHVFAERKPDNRKRSAENTNRKKSRAVPIARRAAYA